MDGVFWSMKNFFTIYFLLDLDPDCSLAMSLILFTFHAKNKTKKTAPPGKYHLRGLFLVFLQREVCPVGWGCRIHRLVFFRGVRPRPNESPGYDTKQSDDEVPVLLEL